MLFLCWCDCGRLSVVACVFQRWSVSRVSALAAYTWSSLLITHLCRVELVTPQLCSSPSLMLDLCPARGTKALVISWFLFVLGLSFASFAQTPAAVRSLRGEKCKKHEEREECCVDEPASPCITHPQESTTDCSCSSLENTLVTSVCKEIKTNKYMFYDVICLCWVFDILLKWPYRWATTLGQTWNHRLHFLKTDTAFLETVTGDPWVPLLWGQSKPPCVYDLHSELERARLFGESGLVKTLLNTNYVLVKLTCCAVLWDGG